MRKHWGRWASRTNIKNKFHMYDVCRHSGYKSRSHMPKVTYMKREVRNASGAKPYKEWRSDYIHYKREVRRGVQHAEWYIKAWSFIRNTKNIAHFYLSGKDKW